MGLSGINIQPIGESQIRAWHLAGIGTVAGVASKRARRNPPGMATSVGPGQFERRIQDLCCMDRARSGVRIPATREPWSEHIVRGRFLARRFEDRTVQVRNTQQEFQDVAQLPNGYLKAIRLRAFFDSDIRPASQFALAELGKCGPSAAPAIRAMLDDPALDSWALRYTPTQRWPGTRADRCRMRQTDQPFTAEVTICRRLLRLMSLYKTADIYSYKQVSSCRPTITRPFPTA